MLGNLKIVMLYPNEYFFLIYLAQVNSRKAFVPSPSQTRAQHDGAHKLKAGRLSNPNCTSSHPLMLEFIQGGDLTPSSKAAYSTSRKFH